ncbi:hypothetical protein GY45DRAFT_1439538 [Cubamyces sp. BRFM 1775]|nr:hypothetical protein GY45DRAFT_1439538 [Cubamyces sp. BRFM 1775]
MQGTSDAQPAGPQDLVIEVVRLRRDNAALGDLNAALKDEIRALQYANIALKTLAVSLWESAELQPCASGPVTVAVRYPAGIVKFPQELLLRIFLAIIPPTDSYDPSVGAGPWAPWISSVATRKALTLVCKQWYRPASEALYHDIVLRRMGQAAALARTLRSARVIYGSDPSKYIKRICMPKCLVLGPFLKVFRQELAFILEHCSNLATFEYYPHPEFPIVSNPSGISPFMLVNPVVLESAGEHALGTALLKRCASGIRRVALSEALQPEHLRYIHRCMHGSRLDTLILGPVSSSDDLAGTLEPLDVLLLPYLRRLDIHGDNVSFLDWIRMSWQLPALKHLTVSSCTDVPESFLGAVGVNLTYLHIVPGSKWRGEKASNTLGRLSDLCPRLEHLVLPTVPVLNLTCVIDSPTLLYLDLWGPIQNRRVVELMCEMGHICKLPKLRTVRVLPRNVRSDAYPLLPLLCDPVEISGDETRFMTVLGVPLLQTSWAVLLDVHVYSSDDSAEAATDSDDEYVEPIRGVQDAGMASVPEPEAVASGVEQSSTLHPSDNAEEDEGDEDDGDGDTETEEENDTSSIEEDSDEDCDRETLLDRFARGQVGGYTLQDTNPRGSI